MKKYLKKKQLMIAMAVFLSVISIALCVYRVRSMVGWRPYKHIADDYTKSPVWAAYIDRENMKKETIPIADFIDMLKKIRVTTPYDGEWETWSMDMFVYQEYGEQIHNKYVGFSLIPEPVINIGGEIYWMTKGSAKVYLEFCDNFIR